ncbi:hypothetical protein LCGC14_1654550 [marine sediment metagenome]|uniref:Uncharacterized protein n=1 Tax=marine sediment metagenome TaxID=412755 RepID=A0A0F9KW68_9ZZZZ
MATSIPALTNIIDTTTNTAVAMMANFNSIRDTFNDAFDVSTGHQHNGVDSRQIQGGISGWTSEKIVLGNYNGLFQVRGVL